MWSSCSSCPSRIRNSPARSGLFPNRGYGWNGAANFAYGGRHLGIYQTPSFQPFPKGEIAVMAPGPFNNCKGSGFGHKGFVDNGQYYVWKGMEIPKTVFEIAVTADSLTDAEKVVLLAAESAPPLVVVPPISKDTKDTREYSPQNKRFTIQLPTGRKVGAADANSHHRQVQGPDRGRLQRHQQGRPLLHCRLHRHPRPGHARDPGGSTLRHFSRFDSQASQGKCNERKGPQAGPAGRQGLRGRHPPRPGACRSTCKADSSFTRSLKEGPKKTWPPSVPTVFSPRSR